MKLGLRWRIALGLWLVSALFVLMTGIITSYIFLQNEERLIEEKLQNTATSLSSMGITDYTGLTGFESLSSIIRKSLNLKELSQNIFIYTKKGKLMMQSPSGGLNTFLVEYFPVDKPAFLDFSYQDHAYKVLITSYTGKNGKKYYLNLSQQMPALSDMAARTFESIATLFIVMSLLAFIVAHVLSRTLIRPVKELAHELKTIDFSKPGQNITIKTPARGDYLSDIVSGINALSLNVKTMLYRLTRTRRYLAHELGNPLTILYGEASEVLANNQATADEYKQVIKSSIEEIDRMKNVVETVTKIARVEKNVYEPTLLNVGAWLKEQYTIFGKIIKRPIEYRIPDRDVLVMLDPDLLYRLVENLIRNVQKHTPNGVSCGISLKTENRVVLVVEDNGPGLPIEVINGLNEGRDTRAGIGLALCLEIASICHFELRFENKPEGGLRVFVQLE